MNNITIWSSIIAATMAFLSVFLVILFRVIDKKRKEVNFLYKRLREFKDWCNKFVMETLPSRGVAMSRAISASQLSQLHVKYQDITNAQILLMDTIMTSNILKYSDINSEERKWVNAKHNRRISRKFINELNSFGNELFDIAIESTTHNGAAIAGYPINNSRERFEELIKNFIYIDFYKLVKEII